MTESMHTLILAGGSGTRLFPLSREQYPKQFIPLFDGESLFQKTCRRALRHSKPENVWIVTNEKHAFLVRDQVAGFCDRCHVLVEPEGKNTLPAIVFGMHEIARAEPDGSVKVAVFPSDHLLGSEETYDMAITEALSWADQYLVTFGIVPDCPHTGYGYIKPSPGSSEGTGGGESAPGPVGGMPVERFVEKPDEATAEQYIRDGYFWNSGMFLFETGLFFEEVQAHAPEVAAIFDEVYQDQTLTIAEAFATVPKVSVDYGIMEKTSQAAVVPLGVAWNDLGSFDALYSALEKDEAGNTLATCHRALGSSGNLVLSESGTTRLIATIGCNDMAIVDTRDALLICPRAKSQEVGMIVSALRDAGDERALLHLKVHRPWGSYLELEKHPGFKIKRITVLPGRRLSLQMHHHRSEHWVVVSGTGRVLVGEKEFLLRQGESTFVPSGEVHRLENVGRLPLEIIEVQLGEYVGEDDIVRFEDDFERV